MQEGDWVWLRTGQKIDFQPWGPTEPDNGIPNPGHSEDCLELVYDQNAIDTANEWYWNDLGCFDLVDHQTKPICEKFY